MGKISPSDQSFTKLPPSRVAGDQNAKPFVAMNIGGKDKTYSPEELTGMLFSKLRKLAEARLGKRITHAVVSVPRRDEDQDQAIKDAGASGELAVLSVVNSYTAATLGYGLDKGFDEKKIVVYAMDNDHLRVTVLELDAGIFDTLHTTSVSLDKQDTSQPNGDVPLDAFMKPLKDALGENYPLLQVALPLIWQSREDRTYSERNQ